MSVAGPDLSPEAAAMARWRHSQRHAEAAADQTVVAAAWTWLTTPHAEQRAICSALHFHRGNCPEKRAGHYCHRGRCPALHHATRETR